MDSDSLPGVVGEKRTHEDLVVGVRENSQDPSARLRTTPNHQQHQEKGSEAPRAPLPQSPGPQVNAPQRSLCLSLSRLSLTPESQRSPSSTLLADCSQSMSSQDQVPESLGERELTRLADDLFGLDKLTCRSYFRDMAEALSIISDMNQAAALLDPTRVRLIEHLAEPNSAAGLARKLQLPRQRVNYHLRELEKAGLVEPVQERRRGNCVERIVRATARSYLIGPQALGRLGSEPGPLRDRLSSAYLVAVAARAIQEVATLRRRAESSGRRLATLTLETEVRFESPDARAAFAEELASTLAQLTVKYNQASPPQGRTFRFFLGGYPSPPPSSKEG